MALPTIRDNTSSINNLPLDRKYRPATLSEYVGNKMIVAGLTTLIKNNKLPHSMLFSGKLGSGKTSMARLLTKEIQCISPKSDGTSCGECVTCKDITERCIKLALTETRGVMEFNMSDKSGKADASNIIIKSRQRPVPPFKNMVFIIDEVHNLSPQAQDALLKLVEEPPEYLYLILCTTNPEHLSAPLRSRCREYKIKTPTIEEIVSRLEYICNNEGIPYDPAALKLIAQKSHRIPRHCINNLEQVANRMSSVTCQNVIHVMDIISDEIYIDFFGTFDKDIVDIFNYIHGLEEQDVDYVDFIKGLVRFVLDCINMKYGMKLEDYSEDSYKKCRKIFKQYTYKELLNMLNILEEYVKMATSINEMGELALKNLAIKIARPNLFTEGLSDAKEVLKKEITQSEQNYAKTTVKKREDETKLVSKGASIPELLNIFSSTGHVVGTPPNNIGATGLTIPEDDITGEQLDEIFDELGFDEEGAADDE